jgi:hypothetical protein
MTRSESAAIICSLGISLSLCIAVSGAQGTGRHTGTQSSTIFSVGPTTHLRKGLDAWPKIIAPRNPAVDRANAIISAMNQGAADALRDCDDSYRQNRGLPDSARVKADWDRRIAVTMRGPRFIAMTAKETSFCSRAYPLNDHAAVVFDMTTGELLNWEKFLAAVADASATSGKSIDGATSPEIVMPSLAELAVGRADPECKRALEESGELVFQIWPDAKRGQLMIKATGQPHVTQACEETIGLSISEARKLGFSREVLEAIKQAHRIENSSQKR